VATQVPLAGAQSKLAWIINTEDYLCPELINDIIIQGSQVGLFQEANIPEHDNYDFEEYLTGLSKEIRDQDFLETFE
jgi:hypothetical protein